MSSEKPIFGYWDVRGIGQPIRHLLVYAGVDFIDKQYPIGEFEGGEWFLEKYTHGFDFPNLPYLIDGSHRITQSLAILRYLGRKYDLAGTSPAERVRISLIEQQVVDLNTAFMSLAKNAQVAKLKDSYIASLPAEVSRLSVFLGEKPFVAGSALSYVDFSLYEALIRMSVLTPAVLEPATNLRRFIERIEALPRLSTYLKGRKPTPFGGPSYKWNGVY